MRHRWFSRSVVRRLPKLLLGLPMFGLAIALMAESQLGLSPWETLHQGVARQSGLELGTVSILLGIPILLLWVPLRVPPGIGTVLNVIVIGVTTNLALAFVPTATELPGQLLYEMAALGMVGLGSGLYLSADLGPGPRDGLMTGLHHRTGWRIAYVRTGIELSVLAFGFALGGTVGLGTVILALGQGAVVELGLRAFDRDGRVIRRPTAAGMDPIPADGAA
ncbi:MAG: hypothetical protein H0W07_01360 [Chloroflexi bacterium]|nr:hypothetical protein [Chloroflexota bacterium]